MLMRKNNMSAIDYAYKQLASAIVMQAMIDYVEADRRPKGNIIKKRVERFIKSPWYAELTDIDPMFMLDRLHSENGADIIASITVEEVE